MAKKTPSSIQPPHTPSGVDVANLAKAAESLTAHTKVLQDIANQPAVYEGIIKKSQAAMDAMKAFSPASQALADLAKTQSTIAAITNATKLIDSLPKVGLPGPDLSRLALPTLPQPRTPLPPVYGTKDQHTLDAPLAHAGTADISISSPLELGALVRSARERQNMSQQAFADLAGVGRRFLSELENGKATLELGKVMQVARFAGLSLFARRR